ncbi:hypothetical protein ACFFTK_14945 [Pseudonocardia petroleophila]|uniref:Uncharacterized protein n=1 Tax=Pseudonocardia petroleophila TaxID=37331 RepID=A0A7G7MIJ5_9PSEU|nr:hypothetical protein [Pseudonocardia petroleophila]QNG52606.1 hypothetical protein H6H00_00490 [Pseudonocardia petroleophila]
MDHALDGLVDAVEAGAVELADEMLRRSGAVCPPTVHLLFKHLPQPYIASVTTRPFRRGSDAAAAVAALGLLPSVVHATRLIVVWEYSDLCAALDLPDWREGRYPLGLVVVDADLAEHVVHWHPFRMRTDAASDPAVPIPVTASIWPEWGAEVRHPGGDLPASVAELLAVWRELRRGDVAATRAELEAAGFVVNWVSDLARR